MFPISDVRGRFPALRRRQSGRTVTYFDAPGGTQVCQDAIDRMRLYLEGGIANVGGEFATSIETNAIFAEARLGVAELLGASPNEISFGPNMTTLTYGVAHALARRWEAGDEIVVTRLDHDANVAPWLDLARTRGVTVRWLDFDPGNGTLAVEYLPSILGQRTRLVAVTAASNALGTITPVAEICSIVRRLSNALTYVDAVQSVPHLPTNVLTFECDFLAFSLYKIFGPHQGALWTRAAILQDVQAFKVRPSSGEGGKRFETGAQSFEALAGVAGVVQHLDWLGGLTAPDASSRRSRLVAAMEASERYERGLAERLLDGLRALPGIRLWGPSEARGRVPVVAFTLDGQHPSAVVKALAAAHVNAWWGHFYAVEAMARLGLAESGGVVRLGLCNYNTPDEVDYCLSILHDVSQKSLSLTGAGGPPRGHHKN